MNLGKEFQYDDFNDPVDLVLATDRDIDEAIERAEEAADSKDADSVIAMMKENGDLPCDLTDEDEEMMYNEDEDDAMDIADVEAQDYREALDVDEEEDMEEDDVIDTVMDADPQADIEGASQVGIYPVWYDNDTDKDYKDRSNEHLPQCEHLHIHEWNEMIDLLEKIKK